MDIKIIRELRRYIREIEREGEYHLKNQSGCCGVTLSQCHCLMELDEMGVTNIVDLAQRLRLDTSTLSRTVDGLVREGYVERKLNPDNRRCMMVWITELGAKKTDEINSVCDGFYNELFQDIPGGQTALKEAVKLISEVMTHERDLVCCTGKRGKR